MRFKIFLLLFPLTLLAEPGYVEPWGKDAGLIKKKTDFIMPPPPKSLAGKVAEKVIRFHQNILSPTDGPRSHFRPTSSQYMLLAIRRYGFIRGYLKGCDRLLRENKDPWVYRTKIIDDIEWKYDPA
ncbi:MAG: membrane protein insertion efficiency factor YidD [Candidatus Algichlamydia australiensis]|nr:membrane protein insertion efficiency factor YidD [Chlamydiales bacterium]